MKAQREKTCKLPTARENAGDHVVIDVSFAFDWLRERHEFFGPITERSKTKPMQPRITQLKIALSQWYHEHEISHQPNDLHQNCSANKIITSCSLFSLFSSSVLDLLLISFLKLSRITTALFLFRRAFWRSLQWKQKKDTHKIRNHKKFQTRASHSQVCPYHNAAKISQYISWTYPRIIY